VAAGRIAEHLGQVRKKLFYYGRVGGGRSVVIEIDGLHTHLHVQD
jgi:hypothetical protein